jgi:mono/diheme cytochrome c family protein
MRISRHHPGSVALALLLGLGQAACNSRPRDEAGPAPVDTGAQTGAADTAATTTDTVAPEQPDTSVATPPITPPAPAAGDTPPQGAVTPSQPSNQAGTGKGLRVSAVEYEGWRQYSVNCARCHGQDVLPNPVAANLLVSLGPNGPIDTPEKFFQVVNEGRVDRGMPAFKSLLTPEQINAMYAYVEGRAERRLSAGRPEKPQG